MWPTSADDIPSLPTQDEIANELSDLIRSAEPLNDVADALLAGASEPERELARISKSAYRYLGVSDDVRVFMGRLWAAAVRSWNSSQRTGFLLLTVEDRHEAFEALDFTAELFNQVSFTADELLPWLKRARRQVGNDLMQRGLWASVQALCEMSPTEAVRLATEWLNEEPDAQALSTIATIIGLAREQVTNDDAASMPLRVLETRLRSSDTAAWRSAYIQSWAQVAGRGLLTREQLQELFDEFVANDGDEKVAWCYLLHAIVHRGSITDAEWSWIPDELRRVARSGLGAASQYWLVLSVLKGLAEGAKADSSLPVDRWLDLLQSLCPIPSAHQQTWSRIIGSLVELTKTAPQVMHHMVFILAAKSGRDWLQCDDRSEFRWFLMELAKHNQHARVATDLCFQAGTFSRRIGMAIFGNCNVPTLDAQTVATASAKSVELLLLEAQRFHVDYGALGRLHAALAHRVDELDGELPELFYEEVARQCRNTYGYRTALRAAAPNNDYLLAIAADAEDRIKETRDSFASPALQMDVPGYARARRLYDRYMAGVVAKGMAERSVLLNLVRKVRLLYGGERWRFFGPDGSLSPPSAFHTSSAEVEMPQLEIANPEEAQMRRLQASARIARLEQEADSSAP